MVREIDTRPLERFDLNGPAGRLHATYECPVADPRAVVVHLHPHPLHGGTRQNNVVRYGALGALAAGCAALRFDFRGVGRSEGSYDEGVGEIEDVAVAVAWLRARHPGLPVFVWGFSFGSRVGLEYAIREREHLGGYLGVAWPTHFYAWPDSTVGPWPQPAAFLVGDQDEFVNLQAMDRARQHSAPVTVIPGATHFFHHRLAAVQDWTRATLESWL